MDAEEVSETAIAWERGQADQNSIKRHVKTKTANTSILPGMLEAARKTAGCRPGSKDGTSGGHATSKQTAGTKGQSDTKL